MTVYSGDKNTEARDIYQFPHRHTTHLVKTLTVLRQYDIFSLVVLTVPLHRGPHNDPRTRHQRQPADTPLCK